MATSQDLLNADLNLATLDGVVNSNDETELNRLGRPNLTLKGFESRANAAIAAAGFYPVAGSFEAGGTINERNQVLQRTTPPEAYFSWGGALPKVVPVSSTVAGTGGEGVAAWTNRNDATLSAALASGAADVGGETSGALSRKYSEIPSIKDEGAVGSGTTSDQAAFDAVISTDQDKILLPDKGRYLVTSTENQLGKQFFGNGHLVKSVTGGLEAQNTYADDYQRATGREYLSAWLRGLVDQYNAPSRPLRIVLGIDSTTRGTPENGVNIGFNIDELVKMGIFQRGLQGAFGIETVNRGFDGTNTQQWLDNYLSGDIAENGDLYIYRPGINDPGWLKDGSLPPLNAGQSYPNRRDPADVAQSLDEALTTFRASKPLSVASVLLMTPNSTYDIPNGRDALYYEQLRNIYIAACRKHKCAFIDLYAEMQDSKHLANVLMDNPFGDGRGIHPNDTMNSIIAGLIVDLIAPEGLRYKFAKNNILSLSGSELAVAASEPPESYTAALYHTRATTAGSWPLDGAATTFRTADEIVFQMHYGYLDADRGRLYARWGRAAELAGQAAAFSGMWQFSMSPPLAESGSLVAGAGFTQSAERPLVISVQGNLILIEGSLTKNSPSTISLNTPLANYSGTYNIGGSGGAATGVATVFSGSAFEQIPIRVGIDGIIYASAASAISCNQIAISISYIRR